MFELPTNKQETETRDQRSQSKKTDRDETELQEFARKLDCLFERMGA
ncbi:MAG: hypothetical protein ABJZ55_01620 [Fuerstiella sp.]